MATKTGPGRSRIISTPFWPTDSPHKNARTETRVTIHDPAIGGESSDMGARTTKEKQGPPKGSEGQSKGQINSEPQNSRSRHCSTIHRRITGALEDIQYETLKIPLGTKMTNATFERILEASCLSRGTPEHLQTPS
ncbi:hypothetical protein CRG98_042895 [Punica granatum]|uniref:Uncharacterized protein n=1 Tax=Punica granatum TaxID=22663 RepID=A0A2I0HYE1_PUNGR|nr:hypothetical protein CRG98_042895 [Punica granatum]